MNLRKAAQMALEVMEYNMANGTPNMGAAIEALRQALAQPEQEPVAWMHNFIEGNVITHKPADIGRYPDRWTALYKDSTPCKTCQALAMAVMTDQTYHEKVATKRGWVGLTDEEIKEGADLSRLYQDQFEPVARWAEAKLKEKNHGAI